MGSARFGSACARGGSLPEALDDAADRAACALGDAAPDVAFLFVSTAWPSDVAGAGKRLRERLGVRHVVGCTGGGICETSGEVEGGSALSLLLASLPGAQAATFTLRHDQLASMEDPAALRSVVRVAPSADPWFLLLADPFTTDPERLLERLEAAYPGAPAVGGLASGGTRPGSHVLFRDAQARRYGVVGLAVAGHPLRSVVSQGCRPVGRRFVVTKCRDGRVLALSGRPAITAVKDVLAELPPDERERARTDLLFGRVAHEEQPEFRLGDFLVRNIVGFVPEEGAVVVADDVRVGQTVQLQLRDARTAAEDLDAALARAAGRGTAGAALLFSCAGRGRGLFDRPDHDVQAVTHRFGPIPLAGFFCNGEIGRVGVRNHLHGFSASVGLL